MRHSQSFLDVAAVENSVLPESTPVETAVPASLLKKTKHSSSCNLLDASMKALQDHENERAEIVIVCEPEGSSLMMGGLHPRGSLYERPVNIDSAKAMHAEFRRVLRENGVKVLTVREILAYNVEEHIGDRVDLEEVAMQALTYELFPGSDIDSITETDKFYMSDTYKREVLQHMGVNQLIDTILINPTVHLKPSYRDTGLTASYTFEPLSNLVYTRDQQITTCKGIVMGRLRSQQRQREVKLMKFCFSKLGQSPARHKLWQFDPLPVLCDATLVAAYL
jgi:arginine deiminase